MNRVQAEHFDTLATAPWAVDSFGAEDRPKIARLLTAAVAPIRQDRLPPPAEMRRLLAEAGLVVDWCTDDPLGYLVRGIRPAGPARSASPTAP